MAHHSEYPSLDPKAAREAFERQEEVNKTFKRMLKETTGATGKFPEGKLAAHDEGEIGFAIGATNGKVVIEFGKEVSSVGMTPKQAVEMAQLLLDKARHCSDEVSTFSL